MANFEAQSNDSVQQCTSGLFESSLDPPDGSFDYIVGGSGGCWTEYYTESSSGGFEVSRTSREFLHAHGESPSGPDATVGADTNYTTYTNLNTTTTITTKSTATFSHFHAAICNYPI